MIENHREEEYIHSIVKDMNADVKQTDNLLINVKNRIDLTNSLLQEITSTNIQENSNHANKLWFSTIGFPDFVQKDRTIQQLKSCGSLRIIRNKI
jgi:hypothetical protein